MDLFAFDDDYVRRLREGDRWTQEHFAGYFEVLLTLKLRGRVRPPTDIADVIQEVFARFFTGLRKDTSVRDGQKLGAFVFAICNHVLQERARGKRGAEEVEIDPELPAPNGDEAFRRLVTQEAKERVERVLRCLSARDAEVLRAVFLHELDKDEICRRLGVERSYLRVLVHRAMERFRENLDC